MNYILEICADSVESAIIAQQSGAQRIELCDNLSEGGTTPGPGKIQSARSNLDIALNVLVRPRGSDFLYTEAELDIMKRDIEFCGKAGVDGIVTGILLDDGNIDVERTAMLVEFARPMTVTFHRAFDMCADPVRGLMDIIATGAVRILSSGQKNTALEGAGLLSGLIEIAENKLIVMPGAGINSSNILEIAQITKAKEYHLTGRTFKQSQMNFRRIGISMSGTNNDDYKWKVADPDEINKICEILKMI